MRSLPTLILSCVFLAACEQGSKAVPKNDPVTAASQSALVPLDDDVEFDSASNGNALLIQSSFTSASAAGDAADLRLRYKVNPSIREAVTASTELVVSSNDRGQLRELFRQKVDTQTMEGDLNVTITPSGEETNLLVGLDHLKANVVTGMPTYSSISMPSALDLADSDLNAIAGMYIELVPGSYKTEVIGDRREHRFAVRVSATFDNQAAQSECEIYQNKDALPANLKPVIGLEKHAQDSFIALEGGNSDIESPVSVSFNKESLGVYLVMDVSSSVVENGVAHHMMDAVSRTVVSLARFADFNYRVFGSNVYEIGSLRDINFDDPAGSGTALYYSIDTALEDIESYAPPEQNKLILAISDGQDLASRNFYPAFKSHEQVHEYIGQRINNVRDAQNNYYNSQLSTYLIELPGAAPENDTSQLPGLPELRDATGAEYIQVQDKLKLKEKLQTITDQVGGTYDLVYSSQQTPDDTLIELEVHAGKCSDIVQLPTAYQGTPTTE